MALTIGTVPDEVITNAPLFSCTTSLIEGASYQNLRIRATVYIGGETEAVAVLEQPKGLDNWDFLDLLKSFVGKCDAALLGSDAAVYPTLGSELLTGWTQYASNFTTFTTSGRQITSAISTLADYAKSNDLGNAEVGDVYVVAIDDGYTDTGTFPVLLCMSEVDNPLTSIDLYAGYSGLNGGKHYENHIYFFVMPYDDTTPFVYLGNQVGSENFSGNFSIKKITDFKNNPGIYFTIKFEEVYENASDVTTIGAERYSQSYLFVPAVVPIGESFDDDYIMDASGTSKWLQKSYLSGSNVYAVGNYKIGIDMEYRVLGVSTAGYVRNYISTVFSSYVTEDFQAAGWFIGVMNDNVLAIGSSDVRFSAIMMALNEASSEQWQGGNIRVEIESKCFPDIKVLNFIGFMGEEIAMFKGMHTRSGKAEKTYYKTVNRVRKVLKAYRYVSQKLRTLYETDNVREMLYELVCSELPVWLFDDDETSNYKEVTVIDDEVTIEDRDELLESEIEIEYYE